MALAESIGTRMKNELKPTEDALDDESLALFMQDLSLCLYSEIKWENYSGMIKKLKVMKKNKTKVEQTDNMINHEQMLMNGGLKMKKGEETAF